MKKDKNKHFSIDEIVNSATGFEPPPLFETAEINGVVVKVYNFIRDHSKLQNVPMPDKEYGSKDYAILAAYKNELENQLKLNRQNCIKNYDNIRFWLDIRLKRKVKKVEAKKRDTQEFKHIIVSVRKVLNMIMHGAKYDKAYQSLNNGSTIQKTTFDSVVFNIDSIFGGSSEKPIKRIERIVSRSADLYLQYLNLHSQLYQFDIDKFLSEMNTEPYGQHQSKEDWVRQKWFNLREEKTSDRKTDIKLRDLYKEEFDKKISTSTIQRYTDRQ